MSEQPQIIERRRDVQNYLQEDEISLLDLYKVIVKRKTILVASIFFTTILSVAYALLATPVFKAETILLPPKYANIESLNVPGISSYTPDGIFADAQVQLNSLYLRRRFFDANNLYAKLSNGQAETETLTSQQLREVFEKGFHNNLDVKKDKDAPTVQVMFEGRDPVWIADTVNSYLAFINDAMLSHLLEDIQQKIQHQQQTISQSITTKRAIAKKIREDSISNLQEQLSIANKLGIRENMLLPKLSKGTSQQDVSVITSGVPGYLKGSKALQAEIDSLKQRESDDPFIGDLRVLQEQLLSLEQHKFDKSTLRVYEIDQAAFPPVNRTSPKRKLIVVMGLIGGLLLGIFAVFTLEFVTRANTALQDNPE